MKKKKQRQVPVNLTSREYATIKGDLIEHAKRYYPDTFQDFSEASFGSMMLDTVAYVGDMLSFYVDYQANESFIDTATEYGNIVRHARRLGHEPFHGRGAAQGVVALYITVPANSTGGGPDTRYIPKIKKGAQLSSTEGQSYTLVEEVDFGSDSTEIVVAAANETGPTSFAIKAYGAVLAGAYFSTSIPVGGYEPYRRVEIIEPDFVEIISVTDSQGREYYEVDYLSQDVVYVGVRNPSYNGAFGEVQSLLKPISVPRRFTKEVFEGIVTLQFGGGSEAELDENLVADPAKVAVNQYAKTYISDESFDPSRLLQTDKMGISPSNTTLKIVYRLNDGLGNSFSNAQTGAISTVSLAEFRWDEPQSLSSATQTGVTNSLECNNEEPVIGESMIPSGVEIKLRAKQANAAQNRAVTKEDYAYAAYSMPPKFGSIKRCNIIRDNDSLKRNLNLYVISESPEGRFARTPDSIKHNLKMWLGNKKMINDTVDILDARVVHFGVEYNIIVSESFNKFDVINKCELRLREYFLMTSPDIGESFSISVIYKLLNAIVGVTDVVDVEVVQKSGGVHSDTKFDIYAQTTPDGLTVRIPNDTVWEIFNTVNDIKGMAS